MQRQKNNTQENVENQEKNSAENIVQPLQYDVKIQSIMPGGNVRAHASLNINNAIAIRGIRIMEGRDNSLFVSMPSYQKGNGEYQDICFPITAEARNQLNDAVVTAYKETLQQAQTFSERKAEEQIPEGEAMQMSAM